MCHSDGLSALALSCIAQIDQLATLELLITDQSERGPSSLKQKLKKAVRLDGNLWYLQNRLFPIRNLPVLRVTPIEECYPKVPRIPCTITRKGKWSEYFSPEDIQAISRYQLDFVLKFGFGIIRGNVFSVARYGIWSFHHDNEDKYRGGPPAFWEIYKGDPVTGALLQRINETLDGGVVLKKAAVPTVGHSYPLNLQRICECSTHLVRSVCVDILQGKAGYLDDRPSKTKAPIYHSPNDFQMLRFWTRIAGNWIRLKLANQRVDVWNVGLVRAAPEKFLEEAFEPQVEWSEYRIEGQMIADPFLVRDKGVRILCEEFSWLAESGRILELCSAPDGKLSRGVPAIDEAAHMSYPCTFEHGGELYCIPECAERCEAALYRLDRGIAQWVRDTVLFKGVAVVDPTVFEYQGAWWLLHSEVNGPGPWSLYVWSAADLRGPWRPHPGNPVKTDVSSSRPAGNPFVFNGVLYRPAQDCSISYGGGLAINRIDSLSLDDFREVTVRRIGAAPDWPYPDGIHTLNGIGGMSVIDAKRHSWPAGLLLKRLWYKRLGKPRLRTFRYPPGVFQGQPSTHEPNVLR
jgi:hypothetical protein